MQKCEKFSPSKPRFGKIKISQPNEAQKHQVMAQINVSNRPNEKITLSSDLKHGKWSNNGPKVRCSPVKISQKLRNSKRTAPTRTIKNMAWVLDQNDQELNFYLLEQLPYHNFEGLDHVSEGKTAKNGLENGKSADKNLPKSDFINASGQISTPDGSMINQGLSTTSSTPGPMPKVSSSSLYAKLFSPKVPMNTKKLDKTIRRPRKSKVVSCASPMLRQSVLDSYVTSDGHRTNEKKD